MASAYDFAEQLLTSQRKFAENVIEATKPLLGAKEGPSVTYVLPRQTLNVSDWSRKRPEDA